MMVAPISRLRFPRGHQCGNRRRRDRLAAFVDHEAASASPSKVSSDIAGVTHIGLQIHQVFSGLASAVDWETIRRAKYEGNKVAIGAYHPATAAV